MNNYQDRRYNHEMLSYYVNKYDREFFIEMSLKREYLRKQWAEQLRNIKE